MLWGGRFQGDGASPLLGPSLTRSPRLSHNNPEAARPPLITSEAVEQPNSKQV
jgi:hypothetical protein